MYTPFQLMLLTTEQQTMPGCSTQAMEMAHTAIPYLGSPAAGARSCSYLLSKQPEIQKCLHPRVSQLSPVIFGSTFLVYLKKIRFCFHFTDTTDFSLLAPDLQLCKERNKPNNPKTRRS